MYSLTIIRFCWVTNQFQGTEFHGFATKETILKHLKNYKASEFDIESFCTTKNVETIQIDSLNNTVHLFYITKFK